MNAQTRHCRRLTVTGPLFLVCLSLLFSVFLPAPARAEKPTITLATDSWAPFYGPRLKNQGYLTQIAKEAFRRAGYDCKVSFVPWKRALEGAKRGRYDGLLGAFFTMARTEFFTYTDPIGESRMVFFAKRGRGLQYYELTALTGLKIGVILGYHYSNEFDSAGYLRKEPVSSVDQNIEKIVKGRIDLFIDSHEVVLWLLNTKFPHYASVIEPLNPPYMINKLYIPISKQRADHDRIVEDLNQGLKAIRADGTLQKIIESRGF